MCDRYVCKLAREVSGMCVSSSRNVGLGFILLGKLQEAWVSN